MSIEEKGAIERLRAERSALADQREAEGVQRGKQWATSAHYSKLEHIAGIELADLEDPSGMNGGNDATAVHVIARAYLDDQSPSPQDCRAALEHLFGRERAAYAEVCGFVIGASEVFDKL